jgi:hypothetical protein
MSPNNSWRKLGKILIVNAVCFGQKRGIAQRLTTQWIKMCAKVPA